MGTNFYTRVRIGFVVPFNAVKSFVTDVRSTPELVDFDPRELFVESIQRVIDELGVGLVVGPVTDVWDISLDDEPTMFIALSDDRSGFVDDREEHIARLSLELGRWRTTIDAVAANAATLRVASDFLLERGIDPGPPSVFVTVSAG